MQGQPSSTELAQTRVAEIAGQVIDRCRQLAQCTEEPGWITRTFLSKPMHDVHAQLRSWMEQAGMSVSIDAVGNLRGIYAAEQTPANKNAPKLWIGSHLDTVPRAGAFDGILGVVLGVALVQLLAGRHLAYAIEIAGFSEEEGVRFGTPFIGSRGLIGEITGDVGANLLALRDANGLQVSDAIRNFDLDPLKIPEAVFNVGNDNRGNDNAASLGYLEFHIEQGPVLESLNYPVGIVDAIVGQSRLSVVFRGKANHAGTTPMHLRHDALAGAAEWVSAVEREACGVPGLAATVGRLEVLPGAGNVIAESASASLDVRHANDAIRHQAVTRLLECADQIAARRKLEVSSEVHLDQASVAMDPFLIQTLEESVVNSGYASHRMNSGAGHDAMIMARKMPTAMLFLRSPGGISHHPGENVLQEDVAAAVTVGMRFLEALNESKTGDTRVV